MALHPRISHIMTRDGFIWVKNPAGGYVCAEVICSFLHGRGVHGQKDKISNSNSPAFAKIMGWGQPILQGPRVGE